MTVEYIALSHVDCGQLEYAQALELGGSSRATSGAVDTPAPPAACNRS